MGAGIDKLEIRLQEPIEVQPILEAAHCLGHSVTSRWLRNRKRHLEIGNGMANAHLLLSFDGTTASNLISNPNDFKHWKSYLDFIESFLPIATLKRAAITRLDLNLDFECSFPSLLQSVDIRNKRSTLTYVDMSGVRTGLHIGKGNEMVTIYDKAKRHGLNTLLSRLELRLRGKKLITRSIYDVPDIIRANNPFSNLEGLDVQLGDLAKSANQEQRTRLQEFRSILQRDGLFAARKAFNRLRNFDRDFKGLINIQRWSTQPSELFLGEILKFL